MRLHYLNLVPWYGTGPDLLLQRGGRWERSLGVIWRVLNS